LCLHSGGLVSIVVAHAGKRARRGSLGWLSHGGTAARTERRWQAPRAAACQRLTARRRASGASVRAEVELEGEVLAGGPIEADLDLQELTDQALDFAERSPDPMARSGRCAPPDADRGVDARGEHGRIDPLDVEFTDRPPRAATARCSRQWPRSPYFAAIAHRLV
jgi:hypothetical protein